MATQFAADVDMQGVDMSSFLRANSNLKTLFVFTSDQGTIEPIDNSPTNLGIYGVSRPTNMVAALKCAFQRGNHMTLRVPPSDARYSAALVGVFTNDAAEVTDPVTFLGIAPLYPSNVWYGGIPANPQDLSPIYRIGGLPLNKDSYDPWTAIDEADDRFYLPNFTGTDAELGGVTPPVGSRLLTALALVWRNGPSAEGDGIALKITSENVGPIPAISSASKFSGGNLPAGTYSYFRVPVTANGQQASAASELLSVTISPADVTAGNRAISLEWELDDQSVRGAMIYRTSVVGAQTVTRLIGEVSRSVTSLVDDTFNSGSIIDPADLTSTRDPISNNFVMEVYNSTNALIDTIPFSFNVETRDSDPMPIDEAINTISREIRCKRLYDHDLIQGDLTPPPGGVIADIPVLYSTPIVRLRGGSDGVNEVTQEDLRVALLPFLNRDRYRISAVVDCGWCVPWAYEEFSKVCDEQRAHAILGMPYNYQSAQGGVAFVSSLAGLDRRQSIYTPWMYRRDPDNNSRSLIPASAFAAQAMLQSDDATSGGAGRAFAGPNRGVVDATGVEIPSKYEYTDPERDLMAMGKVNYFRKRPNVGMVLWEQWTLQRNLSAASYVNVSRLWDIIQNSIHDYLEFSLYEPNDDYNVKNIKAGLREYLAGHVRGRNLRNFEIIMDDRAGNNNQTADEGIRLIDVYLTPVIATRRYRCRTILTRQGANYEDLMQIM